MDDERRKQILTSRRTTLLASLGRAEQFMTQYQEERDKLEVELRLENLDVAGVRGRAGRIGGNGGK